MSEPLKILAEALVTAEHARVVFGSEAQDTMIMEELGELLVAFARLKRGRGTALQIDEEVADCLLVLLGAVSPDVWSILTTKTERLSHRIARHRSAFGGTTP